MYAAQQSIRHLHGRPLDNVDAVLHAPRACRDWAFQHYLEIAPPSFAVPAPASRGGAAAAERAQAA